MDHYQKKGDFMVLISPQAYNIASIITELHGHELSKMTSEDLEPIIWSYTYDDHTITEVLEFLQSSLKKA